jgi:hypothetical protein
MRVTLQRQSWMGMGLLVETGSGVFLVEYDGSGFGERVHVNGRLAVHHMEWLSLSLVAPRIEFELGPLPAAIEVSVWPWLAIRKFRLIVNGEVVYDKQASPAQSTDDAEEQASSVHSEETGIRVSGRIRSGPGGEFKNRDS